MKYLLISVLLIAFIPNYTPSQKETVYIGAGFLKGNDYLAMDAAEKRAYAMGAINGMLVAPLLGAPQEKARWFNDCTLKMNDEQVAAIITKYLRDNPAQWHLPMNLTSFNAMRLACPGAPKP